MRSRMWRWRSSSHAIVFRRDVWERRKFLHRENLSSLANALGQISVRCFMNVAAARSSHSFAFTTHCNLPFLLRHPQCHSSIQHQRQPIYATATSNLFKRIYSNQLHRIVVDARTRPVQIVGLSAGVVVALYRNRMCSGLRNAIIGLPTSGKRINMLANDKDCALQRNAVYFKKCFCVRRIKCCFIHEPNAIYIQ